MVELLLKIFECDHVSVVNLKVYSNVCLAVNGRQLTAISLFQFHKLRHSVKFLVATH